MPLSSVHFATWIKMPKMSNVTPSGLHRCLNEDHKTACPHQEAEVKQAQKRMMEEGVILPLSVRKITSVDPVNATLSMPMCEAIAAPAVGP